jgi:bla regulator protein blaR1
VSAGFAGWAIEALIASALLIAIIMAIRTPVRRLFGPQAAYTLWALPALRLLLPPTPLPGQVTRLFEPLTQRLVTAPPITVGLLNPATLPPEVHATALPHLSVPLGSEDLAAVLVPPTPVAEGPGLVVLLTALWLTGAAALLAYHLVAHRRFCRALLAGATYRERLACGTELVESRTVSGPLAFGIRRRYIAFPRDFAARYDQVERNLALEHELGHHERGDLLANAAAMIVLALHWFNPLAWRAYRAFRADQEMANDARVLAGRDLSQRHAYACAILKSAHGRALSPACHLNTVNDIKGRIHMIVRHRGSRRRQLAGGIAAVAVTLGGLGLTASGSAAAADLGTPARRMTLAALPAPAPLPPVPLLVAAAAPSAPPIELAPPPPRHHSAPPPPAPDHGGPRALVMADGTSVRIPPIPEVRSEHCPGADTLRPVVISEPGPDGQAPRRITICDNRIRQMSQDAQARAMAAIDTHALQRDAYARALDGLERARAHMLADRHIPDDARAEALASIDQSIASMRGTLDR